MNQKKIDEPKVCMYPGCLDKRGFRTTLKRGEFYFCSAHRETWPQNENGSEMRRTENK